MSDDERLFVQWKEGNVRAGDTLLRRHFKPVRRFFDNKVRDRADVQDLVQETFAACVSSRDRFAMRSSFRTYLFTIARRKLYDYLKRIQRDRERLDFGVTSLIALGITPTGRLARGATNQALLQALCALPIAQQVLLELYYWQQFSQAQLAEVLDIKEDAVKARMQRARGALRRQLQRQSETCLQLHALDNLQSWARQMRDFDAPAPSRKKLASAPLPDGLVPV